MACPMLLWRDYLKGVMIDEEVGVNIKLLFYVVAVA